MVQRILIALVTVLVFGAGYGARLWIERDQALPAPATIGAEFAPKELPRQPDQTRPVEDRRADTIANIAKYRSDIENYQATLTALDAEYQKGFAGLLTPAQRAKYDAMQKDRAARDQRFATNNLSTSLLSAEDIDRLRQIPLMGVLNRITISDTVKRLAGDFDLDAAQQAQLHALLAARRDKFLALVDSTPPPSIRLSVVATQAARLGQPAPKSEPKPDSAKKSESGKSEPAK